LVIPLDHPVVMGVLNLTPDSFSDGGRFMETEAALARIARMEAEGAAIIDIGGESTRPGSDPVSADEELARVMPVLEAGLKTHPRMRFSIDTTKYAVAEAALAAGAHLLNDVSGLRAEPRFVDLCATYRRPLVLMHSIGDPKTMQQDPRYDDVVEEVAVFLDTRAAMAEAAGVPQVIVDPGIGFGKTLEHNLALLRHLERLTNGPRPVLVGASRKSMIGTILGGRPVDGRLAGTIAVHAHALMKGAKILRVHDVREANDSILVHRSLSNEPLSHRIP
jgi:dihydropteroate synthase